MPTETRCNLNDSAALRNYTELFEYDQVGNILKMVHQAGMTGSWTRGYKVGTTNNRLEATSLPGDDVEDPGDYSATYDHDVHGNMTAMPHLTEVVWDWRDQMRETDLGGSGNAYFVYGADGQRVRKVWEHAGLVEERIYVGGGWEVYRKRDSGGLLLERETPHVMDDKQRIAMVETKTVDTAVGSFTPVPRVRFQLGNHLGSALLEVDGAGAVISYEEYHPYGTSAYRSGDGAVEVSARRYRYTGKERDEETGLYYHGARYYACWLGRWCAADPAGLVDGPNLYAYVSGSPARLRDSSGRQGVPTEIRVPERPPGVPRTASKWVYGARGFVTSDSAEFDKLSDGRPVFVYDPKADTANLDQLRAAAARAEIEEFNAAARALGRQAPSESVNNDSTGGGTGLPPTELDRAAEAAGTVLGDEVSPDGVSGGIPGGTGDAENASEAGQTIYAGAAVYEVIDLAKALWSLGKAGLSAGLRKLAKQELKEEVVEGATMSIVKDTVKHGGSLKLATGVSRLHPDEVATGERLAQQLGVNLTESTHIGAEFVDEFGKSYDALGRPAASKFWNESKFLASIDSHLNKANDFTAIDLTAFTDAQKAIRAYVDGLPAASQARIVRIGF